MSNTDLPKRLRKEPFLLAPIPAQYIMETGFVLRDRARGLDIPFAILSAVPVAIEVLSGPLGDQFAEAFVTTPSRINIYGVANDSWDLPVAG